jgi:hypothetical protein
MVSQQLATTASRRLPGSVSSTVDRAVASRGSFKARVGRTSLERLFAYCGPKGAAEACQLSQLAAGLAAAVLRL